MNKLNKYNSYGEILDLATHIIYIDIMNLSTKHWLRLFAPIIYFFGSPNEDEFEYFEFPSEDFLDYIWYYDIL